MSDMVISYYDYPTAPIWSERNENDIVLRAGSSIYLGLRNPMPFIQLKANRAGDEMAPPFYYPFASIAYPDPEIHGYDAIISPISIVSVEHANYEGNPEMARMVGIQDIPDEGPILGMGVLGAFVGDQRYNLGPYEGPDDFMGMFSFVQRYHQDKMGDGEDYEVLGSIKDVFLEWISKTL